MLRARLKNGDYLFGLDAENVYRLVAGHPIAIELGPLGGQGRMLITYGLTLEDIKADLVRAMGAPLPPEGEMQ